MTLSGISSLAVSVSVALIMLMIGMLFDPAVFRRQFNRKTLAEFTNLVIANYLVIPLIVLGGLWLAPLDPMSKLASKLLRKLPAPRFACRRPCGLERGHRLQCACRRS